MKLFFLLFLIISSLTINAQNKTQLNLAVYDFRFSEDAQLASLLLDNVRYVILTDGEVSILKGSGSFTLTQLRQKESEPSGFIKRKDMPVVRGKNIYFK